LRRRLFVLKFSKNIRRRILLKNDIEPETETRTINYKKALKIIKKIIIINKYIKDFFIYLKRYIEIIKLIIILNKLKLVLKKNL